MELVIITTGRKKGLLENTLVNDILAPFNPDASTEPLLLDDKCYHYVAVDDNVPLEDVISSLMQIEGIESVYEKPLDFPPM
ncbi:hypothetical protein LCGC14_1239220 [marine sediment metagenome]|uniref:Uncharacterized protein n=2 Tax=root TaxID=1 RepID=A0A831QNY3_9FLAO|nr:hypothetical protein [Pricia sp.]HEA22055.1 hypothetical protein [Pricia antarctica]